MLIYVLKFKWWVRCVPPDPPTGQVVRTAWT